MNSPLAYLAIDASTVGWLNPSTDAATWRVDRSKADNIGKSGGRWRTNRKLPASQVPGLSGSPSRSPAIALSPAAMLGATWGAALTPTETWSCFDRSSNTAVRQTSLDHSLKTSFALPDLGTSSGRGISCVHRNLETCHIFAWLCLFPMRRGWEKCGFQDVKAGPFVATQNVQRKPLKMGLFISTAFPSSYFSSLVLGSSLFR